MPSKEVLKVVPEAVAALRGQGIIASLGYNFEPYQFQEISSLNELS